MGIKLFDSELKVMEILWNKGDLTAGQLATILKEQIGWNRNTTYTVIKKLIDKRAIERSEPNFFCKAIITKKQVQQHEATALVGKLFGGSAGLFLSAFLGGNSLPDDEIERLKQLIQRIEQQSQGDT